MDTNHTNCHGQVKEDEYLEIFFHYMELWKDAYEDVAKTNRYPDGEMANKIWPRENPAK